jgi:hypothetical protein
MVRDNLQSLTEEQDDREKRRDSRQDPGPRVPGFRLSAGSTQQVM